MVGSASVGNLSKPAIDFDFLADGSPNRRTCLLDLDDATVCEDGASLGRGYTRRCYRRWTKEGGNRLDWYVVLAATVAS